MALAAVDLPIHLTIDGANGDPQPDGDASLGLKQSSTAAYIQGVASSVTSDKILTSTSFVGVGDLVGQYLIWIDGNNIDEFQKVVQHNDSTGLVVFENDFTTLPLITENFRIGGTNTLFGDFTLLESLNGGDFYRVLAVLNNTGSLIKENRAFIIPVDPGPCEVQVTTSTVTPSQASGSTILLPDELTGDKETILGLAGVGTWNTDAVPFDYLPWKDYNEVGGASGAGDENQGNPNSVDANFPNNNWVPIVLRLTIPAEANLGRYSFILAWGTAGTVTDGPLLFTTYMPFTVDLVGAAGFTVAFDRTPRSFGGAFVFATVTEPTTGAGLPGKEVFMKLDPTSPGTLVPNDDIQETDENGQVTALYTGPADEADVGDDVIVNAELRSL